MQNNQLKLVGPGKCLTHQEPQACKKTVGTNRRTTYFANAENAFFVVDQFGYVYHVAPQNKVA